MWSHVFLEHNVFKVVVTEHTVIEALVPATVSTLLIADEIYKRRQMKHLTRE